MALSIKLSTLIPVDANNTVSISAGSGVTASTTATNSTSTTSYSLSPNSGVQSTIATITFTPSTGYYYHIEPRISISSPYVSSYEITQTVSRNSDGEVISKVFVIKYTNTVGSIGDFLYFYYDLKTLKAISNDFAQPLLQIDSFSLNTSDVPSTGEKRAFVVKGDANAYFNLKITRTSDSKTYDFTTDTFTATATSLLSQKIGDSGVYSNFITFAAVTADQSYTVELSSSIELGSTLIKNIQDSTSEFTSTSTINQYKIITLTISPLSAANNAHYNALPSNIVIKAERNSKSLIKKVINWDLSLSANSFTFARGYAALEGAVNPVDFRSLVVKVKKGNQAAGTTVLFDDVDDVAIGMSMSGTGVTGAPRVVSIDTASNGVVVSVSQNAQGSGGMADDASITFQYGGSSTSKAISGCEFYLDNVSATGSSAGYVVKAASLSPVKTAVNGAVSDSAIVNIDSENGIKAAATTFVSGLGVDAKTVAPHVDANTHQSTDHRLLLSANQTLADNTPLVFTGSSRSANITVGLNISNIGTKDHTLHFNLDTILKVS